MPNNTFEIKNGNNQILPNANEANQYFIGDSAIRLVRLDRLHKEIGKDVSERTKDAVKYYQTKLKGTKNVEEKLVDKAEKGYFDM